jgi:hypothetical protein
MNYCDLRYFTGEVEVEGATNLLHGMTLEQAKPAGEERHTRKLLRYLFSETPFTVTGAVNDRVTMSSRGVCQCN